MIKNFILVFLFLTQVSTDCLSSKNENFPLLEESKQDYGGMKKMEKKEEEKSTQLTDLIKIKPVKKIIFSELIEPVKGKYGGIKFKEGSLQCRGICKEFKKEIDQFPLKMLYNSSESDFKSRTIKDILSGYVLPTKQSCCSSFYECCGDCCKCCCTCFEYTLEFLCCCCPTENGKIFCCVTSSCLGGIGVIILLSALHVI